MGEILERLHAFGEFEVDELRFIEFELPIILLTVEFDTLFIFLNEIGLKALYVIVTLCCVFDICYVCRTLCNCCCSVFFFLK